MANAPSEQTSAFEVAPENAHACESAAAEGLTQSIEAATEATPRHSKLLREYVVIARRYRPQTFDELLGQEHVARALQQAIASDRVGHAYLFTGARGVGKTSAARILAKALNCVRGPTPTPCNECDVCRCVATGDDVDVIEIDGASNRGIDEIRQLRQNAAVRPSRARFKIYIIDEVHMLTKEAFNALLKTLEEPPEHVKFIFATTEPHKIPITILSRCQRFDFAGIRASQIQARLTQIAAAEGVDLEPAAVQILASRAAGSMRDSQSLLEQLLAAADGRISAQDVTHLLGIAPAERLTGLVRHLVERNAGAALTELEAAIDNGVEVGQLLDQLVGFFRDVTAAAVGCSPDQMLYALPSQAADVANIGKELGLETILAIVQVLDQTAARMRLSMHGRTLVEMAVVRICHLEDLDDLAALVAEFRVADETPAAPSSEAPAKSLPAKKNAESPLRAGLGNIPQPPGSVVQNPATKRSSAIPPSASTENANTTSFDSESNGTHESVLSRFREALGHPARATAEQAPRPTRPTLREQKAELGERPFVRRALELFDVPAGQFRYAPPDDDGDSIT
jgi:DNA polymerase-3 subunit gamma/tau